MNACIKKTRSDILLIIGAIFILLTNLLFTPIATLALVCNTNNGGVAEWVHIMILSFDIISLAFDIAWIICFSICISCGKWNTTRNANRKVISNIWLTMGLIFIVLSDLIVKLCGVVNTIELVYLKNFHWGNSFYIAAQSISLSFLAIAMICFIIFLFSKKISKKFRRIFVD